MCANTLQPGCPEGGRRGLGSVNPAVLTSGRILWKARFRGVQRGFLLLDCLVRTAQISMPKQLIGGIEAAGRSNPRMKSHGDILLAREQLTSTNTIGVNEPVSGMPLPFPIWPVSKRSANGVSLSSQFQEHFRSLLTDLN